MSQLVPYQCEQDDSLLFTTMFDYEMDELDKQQLASFEGLNSGVPTRTTATITPTQLRSFEQTYIELSNCRAEQSAHAGFVPPAVRDHANQHYGILNQSGYEGAGPGAALHVSPGPLSSGDSSSSPGLPAPRRRNMGGRRPARPALDATPEEEERRKVRRERNKMAAARCRKRRMDHTNELQDETDKLESKRQGLNDEIRQLNEQREKLQSILQKHLLTCARAARRPPSPADVKPYAPYYEQPVCVKLEPADSGLGLDQDIFASPTNDKRIMLSSANPSVVSPPPGLATPPAPPAAPARAPRPSFLQVPLQVTPAQMHNSKFNKQIGVEITTPSSGIPFNFESLMEGGTGLTPVHPHPHPPCGAGPALPSAAPPPARPEPGSLVSL